MRFFLELLRQKYHILEKISMLDLLKLKFWTKKSHTLESHILEYDCSSLPWQNITTINTDFHLWPEMKRCLFEEIRLGQVKNLSQLRQWILAYPESDQFDQERLNRSIWGRIDEHGDRVGGLLARARACYKLGGRSLQSVPRSYRLSAEIIEINVSLVFFEKKLSSKTKFWNILESLKLKLVTETKISSKNYCS